MCGVLCAFDTRWQYRSNTCKMIALVQVLTFLTVSLLSVINLSYIYVMNIFFKKFDD